jgi:hypothetical protein
MIPSRFYAPAILLAAATVVPAKPEAGLSVSLHFRRAPRIAYTRRPVCAEETS